MSSGTVCSNCGRVNRASAKMCSSCGKPLAQTPPTPPPVPPPQQPVTPRQPPIPPRQVQVPQPPPPPPRKPPTPRQPPAPASQPALSKARLPLRPWQIATILGVLVVLCLCAFVANAAFGIIKPRSEPTVAFIPSLVPTNTALPAPATSQPTVIVVTATPLPATPTVVNTATPPVPTATNTSLPTPSSTLTTMPTPKATATATSTPTDTPKGSTLLPGDVWQQQGMALNLRAYNYAGFACPNPSPILEFSFLLTNNQPGQIVINWHGENLTVADDSGKQYDIYYQQASASPDCAKYQPAKGNILVYSLSGNASAALAIRVQGVLEDKATKLTVTVAQAGHIENAKWDIPIPK